MRLLMMITALLLATSGCGSQTGSGAAPSGSRLDGDWYVGSGTVEGVDLALLPDRPLTLNLDALTASGSSGCNQFSGDVSVSGSGPDLEIRFGPLSATEMACPGPAMGLESRYLAALDTVRTATVSDDTLTLTGDGVSLTLRTQPPEPTLPLVGTRWELTSLIAGESASSTVQSALPASLELLADGTLRGHTGCRTLRAHGVLDGDHLVVDHLATTKIACHGAVADQDAHVLRVLEGRPSVTIEGSTLSLTTADGEGLDYRA
jgi:heat shock protein HslJ